MSNVEKIQTAEEQVAEMQRALETVQMGLERAEAMAVASEEVKQRSEQVLKVALGLVGLSVLLLIASRRRNRS